MSQAGNTHGNTSGRPRKKPFHTQVDVEVQASLRSTVVALQRLIGPHVTMSTFVTEALAAHVHRAEADHNGGEPFDVNDVHLRPGARVRPPTSTTRHGGDSPGSPSRSS